MKIVNYKKFIRSILLIIFIGSLIFAKATLSYQPTEYKKVYVESGDTLWKIAQEEQMGNEYFKNKDVRSIVYELETINNLTTANLIVGQEIMVPTHI